MIPGIIALGLATGPRLAALRRAGSEVAGVITGFLGFRSAVAECLFWHN